jgi:hypothetical protein
MKRGGAPRGFVLSESYLYTPRESYTSQPRRIWETVVSYVPQQETLISTVNPIAQAAAINLTTAPGAHFRVLGVEKLSLRHEFWW